jgi:hypothetical protein
MAKITSNLKFICTFCLMSGIITLLILGCTSSTNRITGAQNNSLPFDSLFEARQNGKWGFITRQGQTAIPFIFDEIKYGLSERYCVVIQNKKTGLIDSSGNFVIPPAYDDLYNALADTVYNAKKNNKYGLITHYGKVLVPFEYEKLYGILGDTIFLAEQNGKYGLIKFNGKLLTPIRFDKIHPIWKNGKTYYKQGNNYGLITHTGEISQAKYTTKWEAEKEIENSTDMSRPDTSFGDWKNGLRAFYIFSDGSGGFLKQNSKTILGPYTHTTNFSEGLAAVSDNKGWFYIDNTGKKIIPGPFKDAKPFYDGKAVVDRNTFIDHSGKITGKSKFPIVSDKPEEGLYEVDAGKDSLPYGKGLVNNTGSGVIDPMEYDGFNSPSEGMIAVGQKKEGGYLIDGMWGFTDLDGVEVIPLKYAQVHSFKEGYAVVSLGGKWGMIDKTGKVLIPIEYDVISDFHSGLARAEKNGKMMYFNTSGKIVWQEK